MAKPPKSLVRTLSLGMPRQIGREPSKLSRLARPVAEHLVDRGEAGQEAIAGGAQVEPPHAHALLAAEADGLVEVGVEVAGPVRQRLRVVEPEALDRVGLESRALERELHAREVQRRG